jgi:cell division septation protein DedD
MVRRIGSAGIGLGQLFALIFGFLVSSALIFLFGIWIGRAWTESRLVQEERIVRLSVPTPAAGKEEETGQDADLSFYRNLKEKAYQRLQEASAPTSAPTAAAPSSTPTSAPRNTPRQAVEKPPPTSTPIPAPRVKATAPTQTEKEWADAGWTVQVNATTNVQQATEMARKLRTKGYEAYTVQAPMRGQTWYRVRVGRFANREQAKELESRLRSSEHLDNAYVTPQ